MHLGPEDRIDAGEFLEGKDRRFYKDLRNGEDVRQIEIRQRTFAGHDQRCDLGYRHAGRLRNKRDCARSTRVYLKNVNTVVFYRELDIHQALDFKSTGQKDGVVLY